MDLSKGVRVRLGLGNLVLDMHPYSYGREITLPLLDFFLQNLQTIIEFADDDTTKKLKQIIAELQHVQNTLLHPKDTSYALAKKIVQRIHEIQHLSASELEDLGHNRIVMSTEPADELHLLLQETFKEVHAIIDPYISESQDLDRVPHTDTADEFCDQVQEIIKNVVEDLKEVQNMVPNTDTTNAFYLLTKEIAQQIHELLDASVSELQEIEQTRKSVPDADTVDTFYELIKKIVRRIHEIQHLSASELEDLKQAQGMIPNTDTEDTFYILAKKIVKEINEILDLNTSELQSIAIAEVVGQHVVHFDTTVHPTITIGRVESFRRASEEERGLLIGDIMILPADEQQEMMKLFHSLYFLPKRNTPSSGLYRWPADLPNQTFWEPKRSKALIPIQWEIPLEKILEN